LAPQRERALTLFCEAMKLCEKWYNLQRTGCDTEWEKEMTTQRVVFERWILPHRRALFAQAQRLTGNASDAEDLVQETLVQAYTRCDQLTGGETAVAWLSTMQRNLFINGYRKRRKGPAFSELTEESARRATPKSRATESPEATVARQMEYAAVLRALAELPGSYREVLVLSDIEQLPYQEIAAQTGLPLGTVKSRVARGRQRLQRSLYAWRSAAATDAFRAA
jgi:RNA polymerase sigma-70 factor (ECF subfamily)